MCADPFNETKTALLALGGQRVWSLMVTLFGDLAQAEGSSIEGPALSSVMAVMDVRPEAVRVALHRLRNDGWIASQKQGRTGRHALTPTSRAETLTASARIYSDPHHQVTGWQIALLEDSGIGPRDDMEKHGFIPLLPRMYLGSTDAHTPETALVLTGGTAPDWLRQQVAEHMLEVEYTALLPVLETALHALEDGTLNPLQTVVLRCLIVHNWRRIVLRHPDLPRTLLPDDWAGHKCHMAVNLLLSRFPRPPLHTILPS